MTTILSSVPQAILIRAIAHRELELELELPLQ
jgi:hypothetical protein